MTPTVEFRAAKKHR